MMFSYFLIMKLAEEGVQFAMSEVQGTEAQKKEAAVKFANEALAEMVGLGKISEGSVSAWTGLIEEAVAVAFSIASLFGKNKKLFWKRSKAPDPGPGI